MRFSKFFKLIIMMTYFVMSAHPPRGEELTIGGKAIIVA